MPAMPMALSKPPIVVGIRQTSSAIRTGTEKFDAGIDAERFQGYADEQKNECERGEQNRERDFVRRFLALRAFHERDHAVEKAVALVHRDPNDDAVAQHARAAGDRAAIAAAFANDRRGFAGDGGFIHAGDAFDDIAVGGNDVAGFADDDVAFLQISRRNFLFAAVAQRRAIVVVRVRRKAAAWALPRPSATASAKLAKSTVNQSQIASCATKPRKAGSAVKMPTVVRAAPTMVTNMTGFLTIRRGSVS